MSAVWAVGITIVEEDMQDYVKVLPLPFYSDVYMYKYKA